jgi:HK97 family phage prohead protease
MVTLVRKTTVTDIDADLVISDMTPDHYGDVVGSPKYADGGWVLTNFRSNPISTFNHNRDTVMGKIEGVQWKNGGLHGKLKLAPEGTSQRIDEIRKLIKCGVIKGVSAEFKPLESTPLNGGTHFLRQELIAVSICSIPANPNALLMAKSMGVRTATIREIMKEQTKSATLAERIAEARATVQAERMEIQRRAEAIIAKIPPSKPKYTETQRIEIQRKAKARCAELLKKKAEIEKQEAIKKSEKKMDDQIRDNEAYLANLREQGLLSEFPEPQNYIMWQGMKIPQK